MKQFVYFFFFVLADHVKQPFADELFKNRFMSFRRMLCNQKSLADGSHQIEEFGIFIPELLFKLFLELFGKGRAVA